MLSLYEEFSTLQLFNHALFPHLCSRLTYRMLFLKCTFIPKIMIYVILKWHNLCHSFFHCIRDSWKGELVLSEFSANTVNEDFSSVQLLFYPGVRHFSQKTSQKTCDSRKSTGVASKMNDSCFSFRVRNRTEPLLMLLQTSVLFLLWQVKIPVVKKEYSLGDSFITRIKVSTDPQSEEMMSCCTMQV